MTYEFVVFINDKRTYTHVCVCVILDDNIIHRRRDDVNPNVWHYFFIIAIVKNVQFSQRGALSRWQKSTTSNSILFQFSFQSNFNGIKKYFYFFFIWKNTSTHTQMNGRMSKVLLFGAVGYRSRCGMNVLYVHIYREYAVSSVWHDFWLWLYSHKQSRTANKIII